MARIFADGLHCLYHGALNHHRRGSELTASACVHIIMRRQKIKSKGGHIADALFTATDDAAIVLQASVKNGQYLLVIGVRDGALARFISFTTIFRECHGDS